MREVETLISGSTAFCKDNCEPLIKYKIPPDNETLRLLFIKWDFYLIQFGQGQTILVLFTITEPAHSYTSINISGASLAISFTIDMYSIFLYPRC